MVSIGNLAAMPGQKVSGNVPIHPTPPTTATAAVSARDSDISVPITIVNGSGDGPTLVVLSGVHGSEYVPIRATQKLANTTDPLAMRGALVLVHVCNPPSFLGRTVYTGPIDHKNLNRVFPGSPNGTATEQLADFLVGEVYPLADRLLDVHSGDANEQLGPSYTGYYGRAGSDEIVRNSKEMAFVFGYDLVVEFQWELEGTSSTANDNDNDNTTTTNNKNHTNNGGLFPDAIWAGSAAVVRGIPSIDIETEPGMGESPSDAIDRVCDGVRKVMVHLGMVLPEDTTTTTTTNNNTNNNNNPNRLPETKKNTTVVTTDQSCLVRERYFIDAPVRGSWVPLVDTRAFVANGTKLGYLTDLTGTQTLFEATAPGDGLLLIRFDTPPVEQGDTLAVVAVLSSDMAACERLATDGKTKAQRQQQHPQQDQPPVVDGAAMSAQLWWWVAVAGWCVAFGLGVVLGKKGKRINNIQRRRNGSYPHVQLPTGEGSMA